MQHKDVSDDDILVLNRILYDMGILCDGTEYDGTVIDYNGDSIPIDIALTLFDTISDDEKEVSE